MVAGRSVTISKLIDLTGQRFGRLTVLCRSGGHNHQVLWLCKCDCGQTTSITGGNLKSGNTKSCGCLNREASSARMKLQRHDKGADGHTYTRLYRIWRGLMNRCFNVADSGYDRYGGRGIKCCAEWTVWDVFREWAISTGYRDSLTLDRIDNDGPYNPNNCRWANIYQQNNNKRNNHFLCCFGEKHTVAQWSRITGIKPTTIRQRVTRGWPIERALTEPVKKKK